jgi:hypothetical protein
MGGKPIRWVLKASSWQRQGIARLKKERQLKAPEAKKTALESEHLARQRFDSTSRHLC